jgi:hypothetical protein
VCCIDMQIRRDVAHACPAATPTRTFHRHHHKHIHGCASTSASTSASTHTQVQRQGLGLCIPILADSLLLVPAEQFHGYSGTSTLPLTHSPTTSPTRPYQYTQGIMHNKPNISVC